MPTATSETRGWRGPLVLACLGIAGILLFRLGLVLLAPAEVLVSTLPDDAYYYFAIAWNIASGNGSTFDGVTPTNGYHPLWQLVLATLTLLFRAREFTPEHGMLLSRLYVSFQILLSFATLALLALSLREFRIDRKVLAISIAFFALPWLIYAMTDGMESGLVLLFLAAFFWACARYQPLDREPDTHDLALGALLSMGVLARLDLVFFAAGMACAAFAVGLRTIGFRAAAIRVALWMAPVALLLGVYLFLNRLHFDSAMPISGLLKNHLPSPSFSRAVLLANLPFLLVGLCGMVGAAVVALRAGLPPSLRGLAAGAGAFLLLHLVSTFVYTDWAVHTWHFTAYWFLLAVFGPLAVSPILRGWMVVPAVAALLLAGIIGQWSFLSGRTERAFQVRSYQAALWAREHLPAGHMAGMTDCGAFGYFRGGARRESRRRGEQSRLPGPSGRSRHRRLPGGEGRPVHRPTCGARGLRRAGIRRARPARVQSSIQQARRRNRAPGLG